MRDDTVAIETDNCLRGKVYPVVRAGVLHGGGPASGAGRWAVFAQHAAQGGADVSRRWIKEGKWGVRKWAGRVKIWGPV